MQTYSDGTHTWDVEDLWRLAALLKPVETAIFLITDIDKLLDSNCWSAGPMSINEIMDHADRVANADLSYPIILTPEGCIADGVHRVVKCIRTGQSRILAVYLPIMPPPIQESALAV
jgi:disulfide oxidoreductase YuzD